MYQSNRIELTLASGLHVGKETRIGLFVAVEIRIGYGREYGIVYAGTTCKIICCLFRLLQLAMGNTKYKTKQKMKCVFAVFVSNQFHFMSLLLERRKCNGTQKVCPLSATVTSPDSCYCMLLSVACGMWHVSAACYTKNSVDINKSALINEFACGASSDGHQIFAFVEIIKKSHFFLAVQF